MPGQVSQSKTLIDVEHVVTDRNPLCQSANSSEQKEMHLVMVKHAVKYCENWALTVVLFISVATVILYV